MPHARARLLVGGTILLGSVLLSAVPVVANVCVDYSDRLHPVGYLDGGGIVPQSLAVGDGRAYVIERISQYDDRTTGRVIDITDAHAPRLLGSFGALEFGGYTLHDAGEFRLALSRGAALFLTDTSDPTAIDVDDPITVGSVDDATIDGVNLLVASRPGGVATLTVLDATDLSAPVELGSVMLPSPATEMIRDGDLLYLGDESGHLTIVDASSPVAPIVLGRVLLATGAERVAWSSVGVVVRGGGTLSVVDVTDPATPAVLGSTAVPDGYLTAIGDAAYVAKDDLTLIDLGDPTAPVILDVWKSPIHDLGRLGTWNETVVASGRQAGFGSSSSHLTLFEGSAPGSSTIVGSAAIEGAQAIEVVGSHAYVGAYSFTTVDVTDPADPVILATILAGESWSDVAVDGSLAAVVGFSAGFQLVDVANPAHPVARGAVPSAGGWSVALDGTRAYVGNPDGVTILDVSDPDLPVLLGATTGGSGADLEVLGDHVLLVGIGVGLQIVDASDPTHPVEVTRFSELSGRDLVLDGDRAFIGSIEGVRFVRLTDLITAEELAYRHLPEVRSLDLRGDLLHVAGWQGLSFFDVTELAAPVMVGGVLDHAIEHVRTTPEQIVLAYDDTITILDPACAATVSVAAPDAYQPPEVALWPSPATNRVEIHFSGPVDARRATILDVTGRRVDTIPLRTTAGGVDGTWDTTDAPAGIYFVRIETAFGPVAGRLVRLD